MLLGFFRTNQPVCIILLPLIAIIMWLPAFLSPSLSPYTAAEAMPLFEMLLNFAGFSTLAAAIIGCILVIGNAFFLNYIVNTHEIITKSSWLPAFFVVILFSINQDLLLLHPSLPAFPFILLSVHCLLGSYRRDQASSNVFDAGFYLAIASMFYFPSFILFVVSIISMLILRPFNWRELMMVFIGFTLPYLFAGVYYFYFDKSDYFWFGKIILPALFDKTFVLHFSPAFTFLVILLGGLCIMGAYHVLIRAEVGKLKTFKANGILLWTLVFIIISVIFAPDFTFRSFSLSAITAAVFLSWYFLQLKRLWIGEIFLALILGIVIYEHIV